MKENVDQNSVVLNFRNFLVVNWDMIAKLALNDETDSLQIDWLQANWEQLVEREFKDPKIVLEFYGDGADNGASSRILYPDKPPTFRVVCLPKKKGSVIYDYLDQAEMRISKTSIVFDRFVRIRENNWYYEEPPFDKILGYDGDKEVVVSVEDVNFGLERIT